MRNCLGCYVGKVKLDAGVFISLLYKYGINIKDVVNSCQIRHPDVGIRYPDTSGCSHRIRSTHYYQATITELGTFDINETSCKLETIYLHAYNFIY